MPALSPNIENRVRKLPKPSSHAQGMQPLFEAISNAFYAIEDLYGDDSSSKGHVRINVENLNNPEELRIEVIDNGYGLDKYRYDAFCVVDTDFKKSKGGKGVGRLFWLDAFSEIKVDSIYKDEQQLSRRSFRFELNNTEQILPEELEMGWTGRDKRGTTVIFEGLRTSDYATHFPKRFDTFLRYFSAHFIADFLVGSGPKVTVSIEGNETEYPQEVSALVMSEPMLTGEFEHDDFGILKIVGFACKQEASTGLEGGHQLHLLANDRTVETRKIDNLIGLKHVKHGEHDDLYFHGCVSGEYLNDRVNEGRTAFNLSEKILKTLSRHCVEQIKTELLPEQISKYNAARRESYNDFVRRHPIYGFDDSETQLGRVPFHAKQPEDFAAGLVKYQIRRDEARQDAMQSVIDLLETDADIPSDFAETITTAAQEIHASEQLALAQHVVRRKLVLELMDKLLRRVRERDGKPDDFHLEKTLHSFICPMSIRGDDSLEFKSRAHDLWIIDERLAFTRAFSSDKRLDDVIKDGGSAQRPDLFVWDLAYGLGTTDPEKDVNYVDVSEPLKKVLVVEFKKPGRKSYAKAEDQVEQQITKYLSQLKGGDIETFDKERVRIADDCVFYCYVIADIVGDLELQLSGWQTTANGEGRIRQLQNQYRGTIEVIQWRDLVNDAWQRNRATLYAAGLSRSKLTKLVGAKEPID